jgi:hypothetical protein
MRLGTAAVLTVLAAHGGPAATWLPGLVNSCQEEGWTMGRLAEHWGNEPHPARSARGNL